MAADAAGSGGTPAGAVVCTCPLAPTRAPPGVLVCGCGAGEAGGLALARRHMWRDAVDSLALALAHVPALETESVPRRGCVCVGCVCV